MIRAVYFWPIPPSRLRILPQTDVHKNKPNQWQNTKYHQIARIEYVNIWNVYEIVSVAKKEITLKNEKYMWNICMNNSKEYKEIWGHRITNLH